LNCFLDGCDVRQVAKLVNLGLRQRITTTTAETEITGGSDGDIIANITADRTELGGSGGVYLKHD
jgi:hypothetical protein